MKYRALDRNGDYTLGNGLFLRDKEAVAQAVKTTILLLLGEWWENTSVGTPLFEKVLGLYGADDEKRNAVDVVISSRILETRDVTRITRYSSRIENRVYFAEISIDTAYGEIEAKISYGNDETEVYI